MEDPAIIQYTEAEEVIGGTQILGSYFQGGGNKIPDGLTMKWKRKRSIRNVSNVLA